MAKISVKGLIKEAPTYVKSHWNKPGEGEFLSLKEMAAYCISQCGVYVFSTVVGMMSFSAAYFCGAIMEIAAMDFYTISIIGTVLGYALMFMNPLGVLIYENHGQLTKKTRLFAHICYTAQILIGIACYFIPSQQFEFLMKGLPQIVGNSLLIGGIFNYIVWFIRKKFCAKHGRLKPLIMICGFPAALLMSAIPFLPVQGMSYTAKLVILHFAFTMMNNFMYNFTNVQGMVTFMTPNSQERQRMFSIIPIITGIVPSIIGMFFPLLIGVTGGYLSLTTYKVFVPIFSMVGVCIAMVIAVCKERVIEPPMEKREKVKFWRGAKYVLRNKYFWILKVSNVLGQWSGMVGNLLAWWFIYSLRMEWFSGFAANIVVVGMTLGNLLTPLLTRKYQKRGILIGSRAVTLLTILGLAWGIRAENIIIFMGFMFLKNTIAPVESGINAGLTPDILTYHQWKFGERADAMMGVFDWFLNPVIMLIGFVVPYIQKLMGFTSDWDVFYDSAVINNVFNLYIWVSFVGVLLSTIPYFFYDLTKEKHDQCVKELQERVALMEAEPSGDAAIAGEVQV